MKFTQGQWKIINRIRERLSQPEQEIDGDASEDSHASEKSDASRDSGASKDSDPDPGLTNELMTFCMLVLMQDTSKGGLYDSPLMHYLAVQGIDPRTKSFRPAFSYTPTLGRMLWIARLIMLEIAVPLAPWPKLGLKAKQDIESIPDRVHELRSRHLCEGSYSPTSSILTQLAMGKKYNTTHQSPTNIHWSNDEQTIYYLGEGVDLKKICTMCSRLISELQEMIQSLKFDVETPPIDLANVVDSMAWGSEFRRLDYSFITHAKNQERTNVGWEYLYKHARRGNQRWRLVRKAIDGSYEWNDAQKQGYLNQEGQFLRKLMVVMHVSGGQPARGPEIGSIKVSNSVYSARNLYVINGRVCFLTMYDKARKRRGNTEYIIRCLPDEVSQVLVQYLVYVRPFARALDQRESAYLFADRRGPWAGEQLTQALSRATSKHLGVRLTVSGWRHVAIGIAVRHLMRASRTWEKGDEGEGEEEFAEGEDEEELQLNTFRHIIIR